MCSAWPCGGQHKDTEVCDNQRRGGKPAHGKVTTSHADHPLPLVKAISGRVARDEDVEQDCCESHQQGQDPENRAQPINSFIFASPADSRSLVRPRRAPVAPGMTPEPGSWRVRTQHTQAAERPTVPGHAIAACR